MFRVLGAAETRIPYSYYNISAGKYKRFYEIY